MYCHNCGNYDQFVLSLELRAVVGPTSPTRPEWGVTVACDRCASTHVAGDPSRAFELL